MPGFPRLLAALAEAATGTQRDDVAKQADGCSSTRSERNARRAPSAEPLTDEA